MVRRATTRSAGEGGRLDAQSWIDAAMDLLAEQGVDGLRVEPLAKRLVVTKGSFYWHFRDRDALCEAVLGDWRRRATLDVIARLERSQEPALLRLRQLMRLPFQGARAEWGADVELSIRLWGRYDPRARAALQEVDQLRLRYIEGLIAELGFNKQEAAARSVMAYAFMRVGATLISPKDFAEADRCADILFSPVAAGVDRSEGQPPAA